MADDNELDKFRNEWKNELSHSSLPGESNKKDVTPGHSHSQSEKANAPQTSAGILLQKSKPLVYEPTEEPPKQAEGPVHQETEEQTYYPFRILGKLLNEGSNPTEDVGKSQCKRKYFAEEAPGDRNMTLKKRHCDLTNSVGLKGPPIPNVSQSQDKTRVKTSERFLDLFIADLDEINEIPFFDVSLPREVAVQIFKHLAMEDLCHCAQVSKSWRSLADDELLWCQVCHQLGYDQDVFTLEKTNWKNVVRHHIQQRRTLITNWKGRLGKLFQLQHPQGGVMCAASTSDPIIAAGYSNGDVKMWDLNNGDTCVFQPSSTALRIDEREEEGTVPNYVLHVQTSPHFTVASYKHRLVDVWQNDQGVSPVSSFQCEGGWDISALKLAQLSPLFALAQGYYVRVYRAESSPEFSMIDKLDLNKMVCHIQWLEPPSPQYNPDYALAIATHNIVSLYRPGMEHRSEIHNMIDSPISCLDMRSDQGQMGVGCGMYGPTEGYRVHLYDLATARLLTSLQGHTWMVTCLNMANSPAHNLITGCGDRKVRVYDTRQSTWPAMTLLGHSGKITCVQMDEWKVVSGDEGGFVRVWDQRMSKKLWEWHNRNPVSYVHFSEGHLIVGNVPYDKFPVVDHLDRIPHPRSRGSLQVYDFSADQTTKGLPEICHSSYDQPDTYNYNIRLAVPYDTI
ncbi:F-box/WD repeat-containing protein 8-like [Haliotis cracherodii]|uniref:F-box/WD repeat-containing protein 8-like n=1 Tax=Haliotis cracherodii TaxID=6455 RepID=UPI0039E9E43C